MAALLTLPNETILLCILAAKSGDATDRHTLRGLLLSCARIRALIAANWRAIVEHYTVLLGSSRIASIYLFCGRAHRDDDQPAVTYSDGEQQWYQHGKVHRDGDLPAVIWAAGTQHWFQHGERHRDNDQPATIWPDGTRWWYQRDKQHRDNDLPAAIYSDGGQHWFQHGEHRRDNNLPASIYSDRRHAPHAAI